jgi:hypothetical protein
MKLIDCIDVQVYGKVQVTSDLAGLQLITMDSLQSGIGDAKV